MKMKNKINALIFTLFLIIFSTPFVSAGANWGISTLSCTPEEVAVGADFSCTAQVENTGDAAGTLGTSTLYTDANDWLEDSSYAVTANSYLDVGESAEVTFSGLRASKSGINGFSKAMHDLITDTAGVEDVTVNVINVVVSASESASSLTDGSDSEVTTTVVAGGNINVDLKFSGTSGCTIPNQDATKTIPNMVDGESTSRKWTVTVSGSDCTYTVEAVATGVNGVGSKSDSASSTIDCTDCTTSSGSSTSAGGSSSSSGSSASAAASTSGTLSGSSTSGEAPPELTGTISVKLEKGETLKFSVAGGAHSLKVLDVTESSATIELRSESLKTTLQVGQEKPYDLNGDRLADILILLVSTNVEEKTVDLQIRPAEAGVEGEVESVGGSERDKKSSKGTTGSVAIIAMAVVGIAIVGLVVFRIVGRGVRKSSKGSFKGKAYRPDSKDFKSFKEVYNPSKGQRRAGFQKSRKQ